MDIEKIDRVFVCMNVNVYVALTFIKIDPHKSTRPRRLVVNRTKSLEELMLLFSYSLFFPTTSGFSINIFYECLSCFMFKEFASFFPNVKWMTLACTGLDFTGKRLKQREKLRKRERESPGGKSTAPKLQRQHEGGSVSE